MRSTKFLVFQDSPGEGMQADIFKRFYWWEEKCIDLMKQKFGLTVVKKSFKELAEHAKQLPDQEAAKAAERWNVPVEGLSKQGLYSALKMYLAVREQVEADPGIKGAGMNCLNESFYSDTTPCLAWNLLFEEKGLIWACEGDVMTLVSKFILHRSLDVPIMMSNIYPFLMGMAALKHERIAGFPEVDDPQDHILMAHCGYLGVLPQSFSTEWQLKPKVLAIVDENASAIDARMVEGAVTLSKLHPYLDRIFVAEGTLESYVQYEGSDCRNGAVIRVKDGHRFMKTLYSHHKLLMGGHRAAEIEYLARVLDFAVEEV
jgi:L-fucose isomerase-like protein